MTYVVLGDGESARKLAEDLDGYNLDPSILSNLERRRIYKENKVINFGWSTIWASVNPMRGLVKNKAEASKILDRRGINCARYNNFSECTLQCIGIPFLVRKARHSKGSDIKVATDSCAWMYIGDDDFIVKIFPKEREYRAHVAFGEIIKLQRKYPAYPDDIVWNNDNCHFCSVEFRRDKYNSINKLAIDAVKALDLHFGAVDIGVKDFNEEDQEDIVFEVNTAPAMNDNTSRAYADAIRLWFNDNRLVFGSKDSFQEHQLNLQQCSPHSSYWTN